MAMRRVENYTLIEENGREVTYLIERTSALVNVTATSFASKEDAMEWQIGYAERFPYEGYGTTFSMSDNGDGTYSAHARRYPSCD